MAEIPRFGVWCGGNPSFLRLVWQIPTFLRLASLAKLNSLGIGHTKLSFLGIGHTRRGEKARHATQGGIPRDVTTRSRFLGRKPRESDTRTVCEPPLHYTSGEDLMRRPFPPPVQHHFPSRGSRVGSIIAQWRATKGNKPRMDKPGTGGPGAGGPGAGGRERACQGRAGQGRATRGGRARDERASHKGQAIGNTQRVDPAATTLSNLTVCPTRREIGASTAWNRAPSHKALHYPRSEPLLASVSAAKATSCLDATQSAVASMYALK